MVNTLLHACVSVIECIEWNSIISRVLDCLRHMTTISLLILALIISDIARILDVTCITQCIAHTFYKKSFGNRCG